MSMQEIASSEDVQRLVSSLSQAIEMCIDDQPEETWGIIGIKRRGDVLARRLIEDLHTRLPERGLPNRLGSLDITLYRDDLSEVGPSPIVRPSDVPFSIDGLHIVLVDDVLMTGRSIRAALASLMDLGRPKRVWLAVLVDRGGRELPIAPDMVAMDLTSRPARGGSPSPQDRVLVHLTPMEQADRITIAPADTETRS